MKIRLITALCVLGLAAGCSTFEKRAAEKSAVFDALPPETQDKLRRGVVEIGHTTDMVYIALGQPDSRLERTTAEGTEEIWVYSTFVTDYSDTGIVGYRRMLIYDPISKRHHLYYEPVTTTFYQSRFEDRIRITFREGKVAVFEQVRPVPVKHIRKTPAEPVTD